MHKIIRTFAAVLLCTGIAGMSNVAVAQVNEAMGDFTTEIEAMRTVMLTERKILVMREMVLTAEEAEKFWPLYDEYSAARKVNGNLRVKVITDYAANYQTMTDELARQLLDDAVKYDEQTLKLQKKYIKKFRAFLSDVKVTRYFQLEGKLDAVIDFDLASQIPLME
jgi:hypothetical protein